MMSKNGCGNGQEAVPDLAVEVLASSGVTQIWFFMTL
jgi:hypothetical protein